MDPKPVELVKQIEEKKAAEPIKAPEPPVAAATTEKQPVVEKKEAAEEKPVMKPEPVVPKASGGPGTGVPLATKKKRSRAELIFAKKTGETLIKKPGMLDGSAFKINDLHDCNVFIFDHTAQITIDRCTNCIFVIGPIKSSIFVRDSSVCQITVAVGQFRCRDFHNSTVNLYTPNDPILESSSKLEFCPFNFKYPLLKKHSESAELIGNFDLEGHGIVRKVNKWKELYDFTPDKTPNYSLTNPKDFEVTTFEQAAEEFKFEDDLIELMKEEGACDFLYDLPVAFGGTITQEEIDAQKEETGGMKAYDIKKGPGVAG